MNSQGYFLQGPRVGSREERNRSRKLDASTGYEDHCIIVFCTCSVGPRYPMVTKKWGEGTESPSLKMTDLSISSQIDPNDHEHN
jgi:hypothetical protein